MYSASEFSKPTTNLRRVSANIGVHSTRTSQQAMTTAFIASPIAGAPFAITLQTAMMPSPIPTMNALTIPTIPVTIAPRDATIAVNPTASIDNPVPSAIKPRPAARGPAPIRAIAVARPKIAGSIGESTLPATPIIMKAPAMVTKPFAMDSQLIVPNMSRIGVNTANADDATNNAVAPGIAFLIKFRPTANIAIAPPKVSMLRPILSRDIPPIILRAPAKTTRAGAIINIAAAPGRARFMRFMLITSTAIEPASVVKPRPISSQDIVLMILSAPDKISIAVARDIMPSDLRAISLGNKFAAITNAAKPPTVVARPIPTSSQDIVLMIFIAKERMSNAEDIFFIAEAADFTLASGRKLTATTNANKPPAIPIRPTFNSSIEIVLIIFIAIDKTSIALARLIIPTLRPSMPLTPLILLSNDIAIISSPNNAAIAPVATNNFSVSIKDRTIKAAVNNAIAPAIFISASAFNFD